jgi:molecular chaperone GrpE
LKDTSRSFPAASDAAVWKNKYVRLLADFDNHRKREAKAQAIAIADAKQDLLEDFIRILDEMRLTLAHCGDGPAEEGFAMIVAKMERLLNDEGYERVSPAPGDEFDPRLHNAIGVVGHAGDWSGRVVECVRDGWTKDGRQLRAADVRVGA